VCVVTWVLAGKPRVSWDAERLLWTVRVEWVDHEPFVMAFHAWRDAVAVAHSYTVYRP
jgi:hypothetical protein